MKVGLWCLAGLLGFLLLEKGFAEENKDEEEEKNEDAVAKKELVRLVVNAPFSFSKKTCFHIADKIKLLTISHLF